MAIKQTRRSVSMSRETYDKMKAEAARRGVPMSWLLEELVAALPKTEPAK